MSTRATLTLILALMATPVLAHEGGSWPPGECYDAVVDAVILRQLPTQIPDCGPNCFIMRWPWFVEIDIKRVIKGKAPRGRIAVMTLQHSDILETGKPSRWWLRRTVDGGFNVIWEDRRDLPKACPADAAPTKPFLGVDSAEDRAAALRAAEALRNR